MNADRLTTIFTGFAAATLAFPFEFEIDGARLSSVDVAVLALFVITLARWIGEPDFRKRRVPYLLVFVPFLLLAIPSRLHLIEIRGSLQGAWAVFRNFVEAMPLLYPLLVLAGGRESRSRKAVMALLVAVSLSSVAGIVQTVSGGRVLTGQGVYGNLKYLGISPAYPPESLPLVRQTIGRATVITHVPGTEVFRAHGGLSGHNFFGAFLVLTADLSLALALATGKPYLFALLFLQILALTLTFSRAAILGLLVATAVVCILRKSRPRELAALGLVFAAVAGALLVFSAAGAVAGLPQALTGRVEHLVVAPNGQAPVEIGARWHQWRLALGGILDSPGHLLFGHGSGGVEGYEWLGQKLSAHNDVLDLVYARGLLSFLAAAAFFTFVFRDSMRLFRRGASPFARAFGLGAFAGLIGLLVAGLGQPIIEVKDTGALVWFVAGLTVWLARPAAEEQE